MLGKEEACANLNGHRIPPCGNDDSGSRLNINGLEWRMEEEKRKLLAISLSKNHSV